MLAKALAARGTQSLGNHPSPQPTVKIPLEDANVRRKDGQKQH